MAPSRRIATPRLVLRRHRPEDAPAIARLINDWEVVRWLADVPFPYTEKDAADWIEQTAENWADGSDYQFVVAVADGGAMAGHIGLRMQQAEVTASPAVAELGYWFGRPFWSRGYATEAAQATTAFGFDELGLDRIIAGCLADNDRSIRVLAKVGLSSAGVRRQSFATLGQTLDVPLFGLTREAYRRLQAAP